MQPQIDIKRFSRYQTVVILILLITLIYGLYRAISMAWVCDDAFFSFRYAKNLIDGHGLVFNAGERVEGYTNFLWTVIIASGMLFHIEPIILTKILGITSYLVTALILAYLSFRILRNQYQSRLIVFPLAAMAILLQRDFQIYATSGLETAWVAALILIAYAVLILGKRRRSFLISGIIMVLAILSRPDIIVMYACGLPYIILTQKQKLRPALLYAAPFIFLYLPYWIIRFSYYGYPFPNTYYAKSAYLPYYSQGLAYLWLYIKTNYILFLMPAIIVVISWRFIRNILRFRIISQRIDRALLLAFLFSLPYIYYIIRVGGDFMFARLLIPVTPLLFIIIELTLGLLVRRNLFRAIATIIIIGTVFFRWNQFVPGTVIVNQITDEWNHYPSKVVTQAKIDGEKLKRHLYGLDVTAGFYGSKAMLIYYSEIPTVIECNAGLTDEYIAHQPISMRGRPGHEKHAPWRYLQVREVNFIFPSNNPNEIIAISFGGVMGHIAFYDRDIMNALKVHPDIKFVDFPGYLDNYIKNINTIRQDRLRRDIENFKLYYFNRNDDSARLARLTDHLKYYTSGQ